MGKGVKWLSTWRFSRPWWTEQCSCNGETSRCYILCSPIKVPTFYLQFLTSSTDSLPMCHHSLLISVVGKDFIILERGGQPKKVSEMNQKYSERLTVVTRETNLNRFSNQNVKNSTSGSASIKLNVHHC